MPDKDLIALIRGGDTAAFDRLYQRHHESLWRFLYHLEHNENEARDLFQDVWLRVTVTLMKETRVENFHAWLFQIAANRHRDHLRRKKLQRLFFLAPKSGLVSGDDEARLCSSVGKENFDSFDFSERLSNAVKKLPEAQCQVFLLKEWEGFALAEIAEMLRIPVGTVKSRLHYAVQFLRKELEEFCP